MNFTYLDRGGLPLKTARDEGRRGFRSLTVTASTTSNAIVGFDRTMQPTVKISGGTLYATCAEPSDIAASSAVTDAIWEDITSQVTAGATAVLAAGITGLVLVAGASDRTMRVTG